MIWGPEELFGDNFIFRNCFQEFFPPGEGRDNFSFSISCTSHIITGRSLSNYIKPSRLLNVFITTVTVYKMSLENYTPCENKPLHVGTFSNFTV